MRFANIRIGRNLVIFLFVSCAIVNAIGASSPFSDEYRRAIIVSYNTIGLLFSAYAIYKLRTRIYLLEKYFLLALLVSHLSIHAFWAYLSFDISNVDETLFSKSVTPMYMVLIFILITLLLLTLGKIRYQMEQVNFRSIAIKKALSEAVRETKVANNSKSIFLTNMSHELRTPLNIILGFSEALKMDYLGPLNDKQRAFIDNIHFGGKRLLDLINDLLSLSNIETGNLNVELEKIKLKDIFKDHRENIARIARKYHCTLHIIEDYEGLDKNASILANQDWLDQVFAALVDNAAKYASKAGTIWVNAFSLDQDYIRITVKDEGAGIKEEEQENVLKPFNRAGIESRNIEGTGTGLAIAKGLTEAMSGELGFESRKGIGSTFWIDLPVRRD